MENNTINYLITIALFSLILFSILSIAFGGSQDIVRDSLLSILTVSYVVNNLPSKKKWILFIFINSLDKMIDRSRIVKTYVFI